MTFHHAAHIESQETLVGHYLENLSLIERLHRRLLDLIKDEFVRRRMLDITPVQALLLFNIGDHEVTVGALRSRGYYNGTNVNHSVKKLSDMGYLVQERSTADRRSVRVALTETGREIRAILADLFARHASGIEARGRIDAPRMSVVNTTLKHMERYWTAQIRFIY